MSCSSVRTTSAPSVGGALAYAELDGREQMTVERVDTARPQQANKVQRAAGLAEVRAEFHQRLELIEGARLNALGDSHQILRHDAAGTEVQVPHLAVAHLSFGQADSEAARLQQRPGRARPEPVPHRGIRQLDRIALALFPVSPSVEDDEYNRAAASASV
jgi:hypothetical protein